MNEKFTGEREPELGYRPEYHGRALEAIDDTENIYFPVIETQYRL